MNFMNNISNLLRNLHLRTGFLFFIISILFLSLIISCDNPDIYDLNAGIPEENYPFKNNIDTYTVLLQTIKTDSFRSDEYAKDVLGAYYDVVIGKIKASLFTNLQMPTTAVTIDPGPIFDSVYLYIKYNGKTDYFGNPLTPQKLHVYELSQRIYKDSIYYSNHKFAYYPTEIGNYSGAFYPGDSNTIMIKLDPAFGNKILNASTDQLNNPDIFAEFLKGFAIIPDDVGYFGSLLYMKLNDTKSCLKVFYNSGKSIIFPINGYSARISTFEYDLTNSMIAPQLANPIVKYESVFLHSMAGVKVKVTIPYFKNLYDSGVILHKAELVFPVDENSPYSSFLPKNILLLNSDSLDRNINIIDRYESYYDGYYNAAKSEYRFNITRQLQYILKKYKENPAWTGFHGFNLLVPNDNFNFINGSVTVYYPVDVAPLILRQRKNNMQAVILKLTYSNIK